MSEVEADARRALSVWLAHAESPVGGLLGPVFVERVRQIEVEGWSHAHDDHHRRGELMAAAFCYLRNAIGGRAYVHIPPSGWPWDGSWWKPRSFDRDLIRAGALVLAEAERDQRAGLEPNPNAVRLFVGIALQLAAGEGAG